MRRHGGNPQPPGIISRAEQIVYDQFIGSTRGGGVTRVCGTRNDDIVLVPLIAIRSRTGYAAGEGDRRAVISGDRMRRHRDGNRTWRVIIDAHIIYHAELVDPSG